MWQNIKYAPRDGTEILITDGIEIAHVYWCVNNKAWVVMSTEKDCTCFGYDYIQFTDPIAFLHMPPLPKD